MPIGWLAVLAINIGIALIERLMAPKIKRPRPAPFQAPTTEEGGSYPVVFGAGRVSPNLMLVREKTNDELEDDKVKYTVYYAKMAGSLCWGPIDVVYDIIWEDIALSLQQPGKKQSLDGDEPETYVLNGGQKFPYKFSDVQVTPMVATIAARQMFGGLKEEGGVQGELRVYRGADGQGIDPLVALENGEFASAHPWLCYFRVGTEEGIPTDSGLNDKFYWGTSPSPKPISFIVGRYPQALLQDGGKIGLGCNFVEAAYDILTNKVWGRGWENTKFDLDSWAAAALRVKQEQIGMCHVLDLEDTDQILDDIQTHVRGRIVTDPTTGLLQFKLDRHDTPVALVINSDKVKSFRRTEDLNNKDNVNTVTLKYSKYEAAYSDPVVGEVITDDLGFIFGQFIIFKLGGRNIQQIVVYAEGTSPPTPVQILTEGLDYTVDYPNGRLTIINTDATTTHQIITVDYIAQPVSSGFVDASVQAQDMANFLVTGEQKEEVYDYVMFYEEVAAQLHANFLRDLNTRSLARFSIEMNRSGFFLTPGDVIEADDPDKWGIPTGYRLRIDEVEYGDSESSSIIITATEDFYNQPLEQTPGLPGGEIEFPPVVLPAMGSIYCLAGAIRIGLQAGDPSYSIEVERADNDTGDDPVSIGIFSGTTEFIDDPQLEGVRECYRARHVWNTSVGTWTPWVCCTATTIDPPGDPECIIPTATYAAELSSGMLTLSIYDPQNRILQVRYRTRAGNSAWTDWIIDDPPHDWCVALEPGASSRIEWEFDYTSCDGTIVTVPGGFDFPADNTVPQEPPPVGLTNVPVEIAVHTNPVEGLALEAFPSVATSIDGTEIGEKFPLTGFKWARLVYRPRSIDATMPPTAYLAVRYAVPLSAEDPDTPPLWEYLDSINGPFLNLDPAQFGVDSVFGTLPKTIAGDWAPIVVEAQNDVYLDVAQVGGDDLSDALVKRLVIQLQTAIPDAELPIGEIPNDPLPPEGDCTAPSSVDNFDGYASVAALNAAWPESNSSPANAVWSLSGGKAVLTMTGAASGHAWREGIVTGDPDAQFTYYLKINPNLVAVKAFIEVVGGNRTEATSTGEHLIGVTGNYDGSGNATLRWGVLDIGQTAAVIVTDSLGDVAGTGWTSEDTFGEGSWVGQDGANGIRGEQHPVDGWFGGHLAKIKTYDGLTPGDSLRLECEIRINPISEGWWDNSVHTIWHPGDVGEAGSDVSASVSKDNAFHLAVTSYRTVPASGKMTAYLYKDAALADHGVNSTIDFWFRNLAVRSAAGGASTVTFDDLGYCPGIGIGIGGPGSTPGGGGGGGEDGSDPVPPVEPFIGIRDFQIWDIPSFGAGIWDATIKVMETQDSIQSLYNMAKKVGMHIYPRFGTTSDLLSGGVFSFAKWKAKFDALRTSPHLAAGIADGTFPVHYILDEPNRLDRYGSGGIQFSVVEDMCEYSKSVFPDWPTLVRISPILSWFLRHMNGLDYCWGEYLLARGPINDFMARHEDAMAKYSVGLFYGIHYAGFDSGNALRTITAAEMRLYGMKLTSQSYARGFGGWKYVPSLAQGDLYVAIKEVAANQAAHDPVAVP
jgi:hypothetical protein